MRLALTLLLAGGGLSACAAAPPAKSPADAAAAEVSAIPERRPAPFGSHGFAYPAGVIQPTGARAVLDAAVTEFYDRWKAAYLTQGCGGYYIRTSGGTGAKDAITVSEGHGYGMMITALLVGHDPEAQAIFDGLVHVFRRFPSSINRDLMSWAIGADCQPIAGSDSATDGDLDVAFALLLAHRQWGPAGNGGGNYFSEATKVIDAIAQSELNPETRLPLLGDWATSAKFYYATRPSDFMPDHFRAFAAATGSGTFGVSIERVYDLAARLQKLVSPKAGLLPDFAVDTHRDVRPAPAGFLEDATDGDYSYNACRVPWRFATDFVASGDERARALLAPLTAWIKQQSGGDPRRVAAGYRLDGSQVAPGANGAFLAPLAVAATLDASHQAWLDALWQWMLETPLEDYYADSIRLLSMIVVSGNWWVP